MTNDAQLLHRYAFEHSEEAFAEIVRRHLGLVHQAALRQCGGDAHRAQDAAQAVFADLARKASSLASRPDLAGWLYTSTRYASLRIVRAEARRQRREQAVSAMNPETTGDAAEADWEHLRPVIDDALHALGDRDREAVLLRFFQGAAFAEIGARLALTEDAARMRVERALEKMRKILARHGVTSTATALATALTVPAGAAVPATLAASITGTALTAGGAGVLTFMTMTKLQFTVAVAITAAGAAGLVVQHRANAALQTEVARLTPLETENARLRTENQRLKKNATERMVPSTLSSPTTMTTAAVAPLPARHPAGVPLAAGLLPVESLGNAGRATPRATFATQLWAARTGDLKVESGAITLNPDGRARLEALEAELPAAMRADYDTPEKLMAFMLAGSPHPVAGMQVLGETTQDPDDVTLQTEWQHADDSIVHHSVVHLHQEADGWKLVVPDSLVNRAADYLTSATTTGAAPATGGNP